MTREKAIQLSEKYGVMFMVGSGPGSFSENVIFYTESVISQNPKVIGRTMLYKNTLGDGLYLETVDISQRKSIKAEIFQSWEDAIIDMVERTAWTTGKGR